MDDLLVTKKRDLMNIVSNYFLGRKRPNYQKRYPVGKNGRLLPPVPPVPPDSLSMAELGLDSSLGFLEFDKFCLIPLWNLMYRFITKNPLFLFSDDSFERVDTPRSSHRRSRSTLRPVHLQRPQSDPSGLSPFLRALRSSTEPGISSLTHWNRSSCWWVQKRNATKTITTSEGKSDRMTEFQHPIACFILQHPSYRLYADLRALCSGLSLLDIAFSRWIEDNGFCFYPGEVSRSIDVFSHRNFFSLV